MKAKTLLNLLNGITDNVQIRILDNHLALYPPGKGFDVGPFAMINFDSDTMSDLSGAEPMTRLADGSWVRS